MTDQSACATHDAALQPGTHNTRRSSNLSTSQYMDRSLSLSLSIARSPTQVGSPALLCSAALPT